MVENSVHFTHREMKLTAFRETFNAEHASVVSFISPSHLARFRHHTKERTMDLDIWFSASGQLAMIGWILLAIWPSRRPWVFGATGLLIPALLGIAYAVFILPNFAHVDGAGYDSLDSVRALMSDEQLLLAGWIHYLAFDLAIGTFIAWKSDQIGLSRLLQLPLLFLTLMFGPIGLSVFAAMLGLRRFNAFLFPNHIQVGETA